MQTTFDQCNEGEWTDDEQAIYLQYLPWLMSSPRKITCGQLAILLGTRTRIQVQSHHDKFMRAVGRQQGHAKLARPRRQSPSHTSEHCCSYEESSAGPFPSMQVQAAQPSAEDDKMTGLEQLVDDFFWQQCIQELGEELSIDRIEPDQIVPYRTSANFGIGLPPAINHSFEHAWRTSIGYQAAQ